MTATDLIKVLEEIVEETGDMEICYEYEGSYIIVDQVYVVPEGEPWHKEPFAYMV